MAHFLPLGKSHQKRGGFVQNSTWMSEPSVLLTLGCLSKTPLSFQSSWLGCSQVGTSLPLEQLWCSHSGEKQELCSAGETVPGPGV